MLERLPLPARVGKSVVGAIDLNKRRLRHVAEAVVALSASPDGFTASARPLGFAGSAIQALTVPAKQPTI
jgi:hypothetical protein